MLKYHLTLEAEKDLDAIWSYGLENWSLEQADIYHAKLMKTIISLSENPLHGKKQSYIVEGLRSFPIGTHCVYYKAGQSYITVIRVLHQSMNSEQHISNDP